MFMTIGRLISIKKSLNPEEYQNFIAAIVEVKTINDIFFNSARLVDGSWHLGVSTHYKAFKPYIGPFESLEDALKAVEILVENEKLITL